MSRDERPLRAAEWGYDRYDRAPTDWTEADNETERLNAEAYLALGQARPDPAAALIELLRSPHPIDRPVRDALADALSGKARQGIPLRLVFVGQDTGPLGGQAAARQKFQRNLDIAEYMRTLRQNNVPVAEALEDAATKFLVSPDTCKKAEPVLTDFERWEAAEGSEYEVTFAFAPSELRRGLKQAIYFRQVIWAQRPAERRRRGPGKS